MRAEVVDDLTKMTVKRSDWFVVTTRLSALRLTKMLINNSVM